MDNRKKTKILSLMAVILIIIMVIGATFAYFEAQGGNTVTRDVNILTHTVDTLTFNISNAISIEADQFNFTNGGNNLSSDATATAVLTPNSKTGSATDHYYMYLDISDNEIVYSDENTNHDPELLLQVFNSNNQLVTLTGLGTQKTVGGLTGYDITGVEGIIPLLENKSISASNRNTTTENYRVVVTLINHNFNQNDNTGKELEASLIIQKDDYRSEGLWVNYTKISDYSPTVIMDNIRYEMDAYCLNEPSLPTTIIPSADISEWSFDATTENQAIVTVEFDNNVSIVTEAGVYTDAESGDSAIYTINTIENRPVDWPAQYSWSPDPLSVTGHIEYNGSALTNPTQIYNGTSVNPDLVIKFENVLFSLDTECIKKLIGEPQVTINP